MKSTRRSTNSSSGSGLAQVAIWKESSDAHQLHDVFANYSQDVFYDFAKPLYLLGSQGWSPMLKASSDGSFFVFSLDEKRV
ncbi:MAG: hypothetical protein J0L93_09615 [Deltaproteobacteria bacterium]|nr:hypothetical protein [Deltaproteobacteria bacterium]